MNPSHPELPRPNPHFHGMKRSSAMKIRTRHLVFLVCIRIIPAVSVISVRQVFGKALPDMLPIRTRSQHGQKVSVTVSEGTTFSAMWGPSWNLWVSMKRSTFESPLIFSRESA